MDRRPASRPPWLDVGLVVVLVMVGLVDQGVSSVEASFPNEPDLLAVTCTVLIVLPLLWRRRFPIIVMAAVTLGYFVRLFLGYEPDGAATNAALIAVYSLGAYAERPDAFVAAVVGALAVAGGLAWAVSLDYYPPTTVAVMVAFWIASGFLGETVYTRRRYQAALEERARSLEAERDKRARLAAQEERARISREFHDIWAHTLTTVVVQAGAAEEVLDKWPEAARKALVSIQRAGRRALAEVRRLIASDSDGSPERRAPTPGLANLPDLVEELGLSGVPVELSITGSLDDLPGDIGLSAYRIVQQALTNTLSHGGAGVSARVDVRRANGDLLIDVVDDGRSTPPAGEPVRQGRGLIGMRERVALFGGDLLVGPGPEGGFGVHARIPIEAGG
jgi:signal transduction histidine kinase